jgi:hypothetical protein
MLLTLFIDCSPEARAQSIRSGTVEAGLDGRGRIQVQLTDRTGLLDSTVPWQIVYAKGEATSTFPPASESAELRSVRDMLGRGQQFTVHGTASLGGNRALTRLAHVTAYDRYSDILVFESDQAPILL